MGFRKHLSVLLATTCVAAAGVVVTVGSVVGSASAAVPTCGTPAGNWQFVAEATVPISSGAQSSPLTGLAIGSTYRLRACGEFRIAGVGSIAEFADAEYQYGYTDAGHSAYSHIEDGPNNPGCQGDFGVNVDGAPVQWDGAAHEPPVSTPVNHTYDIAYTPTVADPAVSYQDCDPFSYGDNAQAGSVPLTVDAFAPIVSTPTTSADVHPAIGAPDRVNKGQTFTVTLRVVNEGPQAAGTIRTAVTIAPGLSLVSAPGSALVSGSPVGRSFVTIPRTPEPFAEHPSPAH